MLPDIEKLKDTLQDCNINFLLGSGLSCPYLQARGNIEVLLTELDDATLDSTQKKYSECPCTSDTSMKLL
jgi:hypothetical protein